MVTLTPYLTFSTTPTNKQDTKVYTFFPFFPIFIPITKRNHPFFFISKSQPIYAFFKLHCPQHSYPNQIPFPSSLHRKDQQPQNNNTKQSLPNLSISKTNNIKHETDHRQTQRQQHHGTLKSKLKTMVLFQSLPTHIPNATYPHTYINTQIAISIT